MDVIGTAYISKGDYGFYTTIKPKESDKKWFLTVGFRKGEEPSGGGKLEVRKGFLSCYETKTGEVKPKIVILDYENFVPYEGKKISDSSRFVEIDDDGELPF